MTHEHKIGIETGRQGQRRIEICRWVALKETNSLIRIEEFINQASLKGLNVIVNRLEVENQVGIYQKLNDELVFD